MHHSQTSEKKEEAAIDMMKEVDRHDYWKKNLVRESLKQKTPRETWLGQEALV